MLPIFNAVYYITENKTVIESSFRNTRHIRKYSIFDTFIREDKEVTSVSTKDSRTERNKILYSLNVRDDRQLTALIGLSVREFQCLLPVFEESHKKLKLEEYNNGTLKRKPGGGSKGKLNTTERKLFFILFYMKTYPTFDVLGHKFNLDRSRAYRNVHALTPVLKSALLNLGVLPAREFATPYDLRKEFNTVTDLFIDATERCHFRDKDYKKQKKKYSGKQKDHTVKNTIISDDRRKILFLGYTVPGSMHDYGLLKKEFPPDGNWFGTVCTWVDLGYIGIKSNYSSIEVRIPNKKPRKSKLNPAPSLTQEEKEENRIISRMRVVVENAICGMKIFGILTIRFRNKIDGFVDDVALLSAGL